MPRLLTPRAACLPLLLLLAGIVWPPARALAQAPETTLAIDGRANATPWIAASGSFVAVAWGATLPQGKAADVFLAVSRDGGRRFSAPVRVNTVEGDARLGGEIPPRLGLVPRDGGEPEIVVLWNSRGTTPGVTMARSTDGGRSFTGATELQGAGAAGDRGWTALAVDAAGEAHAIWLDHRGLAAARAGAMPPGTAAHGAAAAHDGVAMAQKSGLYYARLGRAGAVPAREVTPGVCYCCKTAIATTPRGGLVLAWRHVFAGNLRDIAFTTSADGGGAFSPVARVSEDHWSLDGCPDDGPAIAVDGGGTSHVVWPTVVDGGTDAARGAIFYASRRDGGAAFTARQRVPTLGSPKPSHPQVLARADGTLVIAWDEVIDGRRTAVTRTARPSTDGTLIFGEALRLGTAGATTSYPVLAEADGVAVAVWSEARDGVSRIGVQRLAGSPTSR